MSDLRDAALRVVVAADAFLEYERGGSLGMPRPAVPERTEMRNSLAALRKALSNPTSSVSTEGVADGLSEAWAAAVEALPEGHYIYGVRAVPMGRAEDAVKYAAGVPEQQPMWWSAAARGADIAAWITGDGPTPSTALEALRLAINPDSPVEPSDG